MGRFNRGSRLFGSSSGWAGPGSGSVPYVRRSSFCQQPCQPHRALSVDLPDTPTDSVGHADYPPFRDVPSVIWTPEFQPQHSIGGCLVKACRTRSTTAGRTWVRCRTPPPGRCKSWCGSRPKRRPRAPTPGAIARRCGPAPAAHRHVDADAHVWRGQRNATAHRSGARRGRSGRRRGQFFSLSVWLFAHG